MKKFFIIFFLVFFSALVKANYIFIQMDNTQKNHLKSYGIAYFALQHDLEVSWLLNYRGGSFMMKYSGVIEKEIIEWACRGPAGAYRC